jgi:hypothetical protein
MVFIFTIFPLQFTHLINSDIKTKSYRNDNMTLTCGVLNVSMVSDDTYLWSVECFNGFSGLHINNNSLYNDNMTLTCGVLNVSMVSAVSISTIIP